MNLNQGGRHGFRAWGVAALAALLVVCGVAPAVAAPRDRYEARDSRVHSSADFEWSGHIAAGKAIEIRGVNGGIRVEAAAGNDVEVRATKSARRSDPDEVHIEVVPNDGGVTICAVYPAPPGERPNECGPGEETHSHTRNNDVQVEFTVRVPAGVRFVGHTVNGAVVARGLTADAEGYTVNGSVTLKTRGSAQANTVNGSIDVEMGRAGDEPLEFATVNGGITVSLPEDTGAEVRASTVNGSIDTDFPISVRGKLSRRHITGTIGRGGPALTLTTVNGNIQLRSGTHI